MSNQTGVTPFPSHAEDSTVLHLSNDASKIETATGRVPIVKRYRVLNNANRMECELGGAELLNYLKRMCGTLDTLAVLMRFTFIPA